VGESGLDFNRNFSTRNDQIHAFREQVKLAVELNMPLFLHEREAHLDLVKILDEIKEEVDVLPPIHWFHRNNMQEGKRCTAEGHVAIDSSKKDNGGD
jgi:TatD DNase family protein